MSSITVFDNDFATINYYSDENFVQLTWHRSADGECFRDVLSAVADAFECYPVTKFLADDRRKIGITEDDTTWGRKVWTPRMLKAGWKYWGLVTAKEGKTLVSFASITRQIQQVGVSVMVFDEPDLAKRWLKLKK